MNTPNTRGRRVGRRPPLRLLLLLTALPLIAGLCALPAQAAGCDACAGPTLKDLARVPGFTLHVRKSWWGNYYLDEYYTDAGECVATPLGPPEILRLRSWLVLRGTGEVWDCPHSKSEDTISITAQQTDSTEWTWRARLGAELGTAGAKMKIEVEEGHALGVSITEVTQVTKTIKPGYCRRIGWHGYFEVGEFEATGKFVFQQRWAWWTKNKATGDKVHAHGDIWMDCGGATLVLDKKAPISGFFDLSQRGCNDPLCAAVIAKHLGWFPRLPPHLPPPTPRDPRRPGGGGVPPDDDEDPDETDPDETDPDETDPDPSDPDEPNADDPDADDPDPDHPKSDQPKSDHPKSDDAAPDEDAGNEGAPDADELPSSGELGEPPTGQLPDPLRNA